MKSKGCCRSTIHMCLIYVTWLALSQVEMSRMMDNVDIVVIIIIASGQYILMKSNNYLKLKGGY